jgi:hypothetical protein
MEASVGAVAVIAAAGWFWRTHSLQSTNREKKKIMNKNNRRMSINIPPVF